MIRGSADRHSPAIDAAIAALGLERAEVTPLEGGVANRSFRLRDSSADVVLKLAGAESRDLGAGVASEIAMQRLAAAHGLAPPVVLADPERRMIVSQHAAGRVPTRAEMRDPDRLRRVGAWFARLHALAPPPGLPVIEFGARAAGYLERLARVGGDPRAGALLRALESRRAALPAPARLAACHHDLHHRNVIDDGSRILAIDWEYAGPGDPAADLAACIGYHALDATAVGALLKGYGPTGAPMRARIAALGWIFDCLWYGWNASAALEGLAVDRREQAEIEARLSS